MNPHNTSPAEPEWSNEDFLDYVQEHSKTERALFSYNHVRRLILLAGLPNNAWFNSIAATPDKFISIDASSAASLISHAVKRMAWVNTEGPLRYDAVPQFPQAHWGVDISWSYLEEYIHIQSNAHTTQASLDLEPDFQRAHVWTYEQQVAYVEYVLKGGEVSRTLTFNCPGWNSDWRGPYVIIDGKQRLEAVRRFLRGELLAFGRYFSEFTGSMRLTGPSFRWNVCALESRAEVLRMYLNINAGGTPHTPVELSRVRQLLVEADEQLNDDNVP